VIDDGGVVFVTTVLALEAIHESAIFGIIECEFWHLSV